MNWVTALLVYVVLWFVALFCVLPIGVKPIEEPESGYDTGAPENPRIGFKLLLATGISLASLGLVYLIVQSDWISFRRS